VSDCVDCHTIRGAAEEATEPAPDLSHLADRPHLAATFLPNTRANLADWIAHPRAIKPGAEMPATDLSEEDLDVLLDYLEGLE
jgi:cytochrome c oxidase subunit 2